MSSLLDTLTGLTSPWGYLLVGLLAALEAAAFVGLVIPGEAAMLTGGFLVYQGHAELVPMMAAAAAGGIVGDSLGYEIGRRLGPRLRTGWLGRRVGAARWERAEVALHRNGAAAVFIGRFIGVLRALVPPLAGMAGMPYRRFLAANAAGGLLWGPALVAAGYLAGGSYRHLGARVSLVGLALLGLVALAVAAGQARRPVRRAVEAAVEGARRIGIDVAQAWLATALAALAGATVGLAALTDAVGDHDELVGVDRGVTRWVVGHRVPAVTEGFRALTWLGSEAVLVPLVLIVAGVLVWRAANGWLRAGLFAAANGGAAALAWLLKDLVDRARPPAAGRLVAVDSASFPSGHATQVAAFFGSLALLLLLSQTSRRTKLTAIGAAAATSVLVGASRVYLGVHWASDVAAGYLLAVAWLAALGTIVAALTARPSFAAWRPVIAPLRRRRRRHAA